MDTPEKINAALDKISSQIKEQGEKALAEAQKGITMSQAQKERVDEMLVKQGELQANLQAAEQKLAQLEQMGLDGDGRPKSMGEQVIESEAFNAWAANPNGVFRMPVRSAITSGGSSAGDLIVPQRVPGIVATPNQQLRIRDLLTWGRTSSNSVEFVRENVFTNNAAPVSENPGSAKPESNITFEDASAPVVTIAHWIGATKQVLADAPMLQSYIDGRLRYGLKFKEDRQLLKGSGSGLNINGIYTQATAYSNPGVVVQSETRIDRLRLAMLQVELSEYPADGIVLSPIDWAAIELTKTQDNAYLFASPRGLAVPGLWGRSIVTTQAMDAGDFLVGAFALGAQGWDREDMSVTLATQDQDDFVKNKVKLLCEERLALTVFRTAAFVKGDFDDIDPSSSST